MKKLTICLVIVAMIFVAPLSVFAETELMEKIYLVKKGDTPSDIFFMIWIISKAAPKKILDWNPDMGLHLIYPGQKIKYYLSQDESKKELDEISVRLSRIEKQISEIGITRAIDELLKTVDSQTAGQIEALRTDLKQYDQKIDRRFNQLESKFAQMNNLLKDSTAKADDSSARITRYLVYLFLLFVLAVAILVLILIAAAKKQPKIERKIEIELEGKKYIYYPQIDPDGKYISLHQSKEGGNYLTFREIGDLYRSVKTSFRKNPELIEQEIRADRLKLI